MKQRGWSSISSADTIRYWNAPGNKVWAIPYDVVTVGNFYNKQIFDRLQLVPPTTYAGYEAMLAKLKAGGVTPFAVGGKEYTLVWMFDQLAHGAVPYAYLDRINNQLDPKATWETPALVRVATIIQEWAGKGYFQDSYLGTSGADADSLFLTGRGGDRRHGLLEQLGLRAAGEVPRALLRDPAAEPEAAAAHGRLHAEQRVDGAEVHEEQGPGAPVHRLRARPRGRARPLEVGRCRRLPLPRSRPPRRSRSSATSTLPCRSPSSASTVRAGSGELLTEFQSVLQQLASSRLSPKDAMAQMQDTYERVAGR